MTFLGKIKIGKKMALSFLIIVIIIALIGGIGVSSLGKVNLNSKNMYSNNLQSVYRLMDIKQQMMRTQNDMLNLLYLKDDTKKAGILEDINKSETENDNSIKIYTSIASNEDEKQSLNSFSSKLQDYRQLKEKMIEALNNNNYQEADKYYREIDTSWQAIFSDINELIDSNLSKAKASDTNNQEVFSSASTGMTIYIFLGIIISIILGVVITRQCTVPIRKMKEYARRIAGYDFSTPIIIAGKDEFAEVSQHLNTAQKNVKTLVETILDDSQSMSASSEQLNGMVQELNASFESINDSSKEINNGVQESSSASEEIMASMEEVDASINKLSEKVMDGSNNANEAKERAAEMQNSCEESSKSISNLHREKSEKILKAIEDGKVVEDIGTMSDSIASIAEQINLLALNAAIEAARAGEHGRGFAVVAEEVRKLAEESANSVKDIKETIVSVQKAFKNLSENSNEVLRFINEDIENQFEEFGKMVESYYKDSNFVSGITEELASMTEEITATVGQVSAATQDMVLSMETSSESVNKIEHKMAEVTSGVEQVAVTSESQSEMSQNLNKIIQKFKI